MATQPTEFHNSPVSASRKSRLSEESSAALKLAAQLARQLGMTETWANVQTIRLAIEGEARFSDISLAVAAAVILEAAQEWIPNSNYSFTPEWEKREHWRENSVDRFWFEDARWRMKACYLEFRAWLREQPKMRLA